MLGDLADGERGRLVAEGAGEALAAGGDGVDGFVSSDAAVLNARLRDLMEDRELARTLGARARETVAAKFPMEAFCEKWREAIYAAAERSTRRAWHASKAASPPPDAPHVLLHYIASPLTTGRYFDTAAQGIKDMCGQTSIMP